MDQAKIRLSPTEMEMATSADLILTKNAILQKVNQLLAGLQQQHAFLVYSTECLPPALTGSSPKISRGENYKGLPYFMLDYPRVFEQENIAAIRTMFWWGNFFSVTIHLSGTYKKKAEKKIMEFWPRLKEKGFYICINEDQWEHHFETDNYQPLIVLTGEQQHDLVYKRSFIKIANKIAITEWEDAPAQLTIFFEQLLLLLQD
ncbi:MAG TPA: hypothetical protein VGO58_16005 [Chitinophagaceae bacterium]|jgi:hypothetical protein|nr:hypothetical protein [Chitinophagaceae bacterium]